MEVSISPRDVLRIFFRHKKKIAATWLLAIALSVAALCVMQPAFRSESKLFLRLGRENATLDATATIGQGPAIAVPSSREEEINSVIEVLGSTEILEQIVDTFGPAAILGGANAAGAATSETPQAAPAAAGTNPASTSSASELAAYVWERINPVEEIPEREKALAKLGRRLNIWSSRKSNVVAVAYDGPTPELAQQVVDKIVELYLERHVRMNRTEGSHEFFVQQTEELRQRLTEAEDELCRLKNSTGLASVDEQRKLLVDRIGALESDMFRTGAELAATEAEAAALAKRLKELPAQLVSNKVAGFPNQAADGMRQQLYALQLKEQELSSIYTEAMPQLREVRRQIKEAQAVLAQEEKQREQTTTALNSNQLQLELALYTKTAFKDALQAKSEALHRQLAEARSGLETLNNNALQLARLEREVQVQEASYRRQADSLEQARLEEQLQAQRISNISVVQPASISYRAVRPNKPMMLAGGLLGGLIAALALALLAEYFDHSVKSVDDVERMLQVPALASIPRLHARQVRLQPAGKITQHDYAHS